jgi:hypothetical protein
MNWEKAIRILPRGNKIISTELFTAKKFTKRDSTNVHTVESDRAKVVHRGKSRQGRAGE